MNMKSVYYAHAICLYGREAERDELRAIRGRFPRSRIVNPARYRRHPEKLLDTVGFCFRLVERCDGLVFSRILGKVTTGVGKEVNHALSLGKPVLELVGPKFVRRKERVRYISRLATRALYRQWHQRNGSFF